MKKIAIVAPMSYRGGTELSLIQLLRLIPEKQYDITLLVIGGRCDIESEVPEWIKISPVTSNSCGVSIKESVIRADFFAAIKTAWRTFQRKVFRILFPEKRFSHYSLLMEQYEKPKEEYDVAIAWALPSAIENVYVLENVKAKRKAMWVHMDVTKDKPPVDAVKYYERYNDIFCVSAACKAIFEEVYPECSEKTRIHYNIIDKDRLREKAKKTVLLDDAPCKIMTCGRISSQKQPMMAIKIVKRLLDNGFCDFRWYFVGGGEQENELQEAIRKEHLQDYVILLGLQENPYSYVSKADLYVQMSRHESFCLTLAEAQLLGIPAVTTNFPSAYEIVDNGRTGYIVNNDAEEMFAAILSLMMDKNRLEEMKSELAKNCTVPVGDPVQFLRYIDNAVWQ